MSDSSKFYTWNSCSTCRDAKKLLDELGVEVAERDFFRDTLSRDELTSIVDAVGIENLFSWRSPSSKPYRDRRATISRDELIDAMLGEPRLIRRPILTRPDAAPIVGFNKDAYRAMNG